MAGIRGSAGFHFLFLDWDGGCTEPIGLEVACFKVAEMSKLGQLDIPHLSTVFADCFVQVDDFTMGRGGKGAEKLKDVLCILLKFGCTVGEHVTGGGSCCIPSNGPISMGLDDLGRFAAPESEFESPKRHGCFVIRDCGERTGENGVEIDRRSR